MGSIKKIKEVIWHCGVRAFCEHTTCLGAWFHLIFSGIIFTHIHARPFIYHEIDWNICAYCKRKQGEVTFEFSCIDGSICTNCSDKWYKDHPKALSKKDTALCLSMLKGSN